MRSALVDSEEKAKAICDELYRRYPGSLNYWEPRSDVWSVHSSMDAIAFFQVVDKFDPINRNGGGK